MVSDFDKANVDKIMKGMGNWFSAEIFRLMGKADLTNRMKLATAFPEIYEEWYKWNMGQKKEEPDLVETLEAVFGAENVFVIDGEDDGE